MLNGGWTIRAATVLDARAIAEVHVESYKSVYRGILPDALIEGLTVQHRDSGWRDLLSAEGSTSAITLAGCDADGHVVGFASGGKERTGQLTCDGELYALYLRPQVHRQGLGAALVRQFGQELAARGFGSMALWVLELNPARQFYERLGGCIIGQQEIERAGQTFIEVAYGWQSLKWFA